MTLMKTFVKLLPRENSWSVQDSMPHVRRSPGAAHPASEQPQAVARLAPEALNEA